MLPLVCLPLPGEGGWSLWVAEASGEEPPVCHPNSFPKQNASVPWHLRLNPSYKNSRKYWLKIYLSLSICPQRKCPGVVTANRTAQLLTRDGYLSLPSRSHQILSTSFHSMDCPWGPELSGGKPKVFCKVNTTSCLVLSHSVVSNSVRPYEP